MTIVFENESYLDEPLEDSDISSSESYRPIGHSANLSGNRTNAKEFFMMRHHCRAPQHGKKVFLDLSLELH